MKMATQKMKVVQPVVPPVKEAKSFYIVEVDVDTTNVTSLNDITIQVAKAVGLELLKRELDRTKELKKNKLKNIDFFLN